MAARQSAGGRLPPAFVSALGMEPSDHLAMQAALQPFVDSAISKTVNVLEDYPFDQFQQLYLLAFPAGAERLYLFGRIRSLARSSCTPMGNPASSQPSHCCGIEREDDSERDSQCRCQRLPGLSFDRSAFRAVCRQRWGCRH